MKRLISRADTLHQFTQTLPKAVRVKAEDRTEAKPSRMLMRQILAAKAANEVLQGGAEACCKAALQPSVLCCTPDGRR